MHETTTFLMCNLVIGFSSNNPTEDVSLFFGEGGGRKLGHSKTSVGLLCCAHRTLQLDPAKVTGDQVRAF